MMNLRVDKLAELFESKLLQHLLSDLEFKEDDMSDDCKRYIAALRKFILSNCCDYDLITLEMILYLDSDVLCNIYKVHSIAHESPLEILFAAGASKLALYWVKFNDHAKYANAIKMACKFDRCGILQDFKEHIGSVAVDIASNAFTHDSVETWFHFDGEISADVAKTAFEHFKFCIAERIMQHLPGIKLKLVLQPAEYDYRALLFMKKYSKLPTNIVKELYEFTKPSCFDDIFVHADELGLELNWDNIYRRACWLGMIRTVSIAIGRAKYIQGGFDVTCYEGHLNIAKFIYESGAMLTPLDTKSFKSAEVINWLTTVGLVRSDQSSV